MWPNLDVEVSATSGCIATSDQKSKFLTSFILSLVKSIDIRTEAAVKLIGEFLDLSGRRSPSGGTIAEHFVHGGHFIYVYSTVQCSKFLYRIILVFALTVS